MSNDELPRDAELSALYREVADAVPPSALDRRILAAAQAAVTATKPVAPRARPWWLRLAAPMGVFATLVLTVTVVMLVEHEQKDLLPRGEEAPAAAPAPLRNAVPQGRMMEKEQEAPPAASMDKAPHGALAPEPRRQRSEAEAMAEPERRAEPELAAPLAAKPAAPAAAIGTGAAGSMQAAPSPSPFPQPAEADSAKKSSRDEAPAPATAAPALRFQGQTGPAESKAEAPRPAAAPAPMLERARPAAKSKSQASSLDQAQRTPAAWLGDIRRLRAEGREAEAREQLDRFHKAYPDYPLPADLR